VHAAEEGECGFPQPGLGGNSPILVYPPPPQGLEKGGGVGVAVYTSKFSVLVLRANLFGALPPSPTHFLKDKIDNNVEVDIGLI